MREPWFCVLALLGSTAPAQRRPTLLLGADHRMLQSGLDDELGRFYPSVTGDPVPDGDPWPVFRAFCQRHAETLRTVLVQAATQINEVARCGALMPAVSAVVSRAPNDS